jgi:hypothetical protein
MRCCSLMFMIIVFFPPKNLGWRNSNQQDAEEVADGFTAMGQAFGSIFRVGNHSARTWPIISALAPACGFLKARPSLPWK